MNEYCSSEQERDDGKDIAKMKRTEEMNGVGSFSVNLTINKEVDPCEAVDQIHHFLHLLVSCKEKEG